MELLLALLASLAYLTAVAVLAFRARREAAAPSPDSADALTGLPAAGLAGIAVHAALLFRSLSADGGVSLDPFDAASLVCWVAALALFFVALKRPLANLGVLVFPACLLSVLASVIWTGSRPESDPGHLGFQTHVTTSIIAYGVLMLAACQSVVVAIQERRLAARRPGGWLRLLPALTTQETLLFQLLGVGFFMLSLSLASGLVFVDDLLGQHLAHKTALAFLAWAIFAALLWGRWRQGWRGRTAVRLVLSGFGVLLLAYFGSKLVLEMVLERHWFAS